MSPELPTWSEHLAWVDDTEFAVLMRQREGTGRPLGDREFLKQMGELISRDLLPQKRGPKGPREKPKAGQGVVLGIGGSLGRVRLDRIIWGHDPKCVRSASLHFRIWVMSPDYPRPLRAGGNCC